MKLHPVLFVALLLLLVYQAYGQDTHALPIDIENAADIELLTSLNSGTTAVTSGWSPDGATLAVATESKVLLYDAGDPGLAPLELPIAQVISLVFNPDGQSLATSS